VRFRQRVVGSWENAPTVKILHCVTQYGQAACGDAECHVSSCLAGVSRLPLQYVLQ
jgi:hypothetical protein